MREESINTFVKSRGAFVLSVICTAVVAIYKWRNSLACDCELHGTIYELICSASEMNGVAELAISISLMAFTAVSLLWLDKVFMFLGGASSLQATLYILFMMMLPTASLQVGIGTLLALLLLYCTMHLFTLYDDTTSRARIFVIFALVSGLGLTFNPAIFSLPVWIIGIAQVRAMNLKSAIAIMIGIITPYWIVFGTGIATPGDFVLPELTPIWQCNLLMPVESLCIPLACGFVAMAALAAIGFNMFTLIRYTLRPRVFNGFIIILLIWSIIMIIIDYINAEVYAPTLMMCGAMQIAHLFNVTEKKRHYIPIAIITVICFAIAIAPTIYNL